jgi:hypothetical protein
MSSPIAYQEIYKAAHEDFIIPSYEVAPFTTIQNRALVTRSMKAIAGVERIHIKGINLLQNEFGPNGEQAYELSNKDARIRFGGSWTLPSGAQGTIAISTILNSFVEITYYGTGLNVLILSDVGSGDFRSTIDGGSESANLYTVSSSILTSRNYAINVVKNVTTGLSLGWHTIKLRVGAAGTANGLSLYGFEVLNQRTDLAVYSGAGISNGSIQGLSALTTSAFNAGVSGTRGARVVKYIQNGVVSQAIQEVDTTSKFLTLADHTNEEAIRRINFREFGCNRADDFSTLGAATSARAFTLDDGTTTLTTSHGWADVNGMIIGNALNGFTTLTFVGTGLDITSLANAAGETITVFVDGTSVGTLPVATNFGSTILYKVCSGLPYGTHAVKFQNTVDGSDRYVQDFIVYQPKKPSIPTSALEIVDCNVVANYIEITSPSNPMGKSSTGVIRKFNMRELTYVGAWSLSAIDIVNAESGFTVISSTVGNYYEYTFYGTGFNLNIPGGTGSGITTSTVSINGVTNLTGAGYTTSIVTSGTATFTGTTGVINVPISAAIFTISVKNMPIGLYTVRVTKTTGAFSSYSGSFDIITPIHINDSSLKIGSQSLKTVTKFSPEKSISNVGPDLSKAKAYLFFDGANSKILNSMNISAVVNISAGAWIVYFDKPFKNENFIIAGMCEFPEIQYDRTPATAVSGSNRVHIYTSNSAGTYSSTNFSIVCFGELIDE